MANVTTVGNTDEELCNRWMQLAAFTPFFRNHNIRGAIPQEPYRWDTVAHASRTAIAVRYALLPYWVCLFSFRYSVAFYYNTSPPVYALCQRIAVRNAARPCALFRISSRARTASRRPPVHGRERYPSYPCADTERVLGFR